MSFRETCLAVQRDGITREYHGELTADGGGRIEGVFITIVDGAREGKGVYLVIERRS
jgi:hypothetical protein